MKKILSQSGTQPRSTRHASSVFFLCLFLRRHFTGKPVLASRYVGCFFFILVFTILNELAAVYYTKKDLTEISLKGHLFGMLVHETYIAS